MAELRDDALALLEAARSAHDPSPVERQRGDASVRAALAGYGVQVPPLGAPAPAPAPWQGFDPAREGATTAGLGAGGVAKIGVVVLALGAGAWLGLSAHERAPTTAAPASTATSLVAPPPAVPAVALAAVPSTPTPAPVIAVAQPTVPSTSAAIEPARSRARASVRRALQPTPVPEPPTGIDAELRMISEADALLRAERFDAALRTLALHAERFPQGALREERAALRVLALCGREPSPRALAERERFLRSAPQSVLTARVSAACADPEAQSP